MNRRILTASLSIAAAALLLSSPAVASAAPTQQTTFSVFGAAPSGTFSPAELSSTLAAQGAPMASAAKASSEWNIVATWNDNKAKQVILRDGSSTWGLLKMKQKHNTTTAVAKTVTKHPILGRTVESASSTVYKSPVSLVTCDAWGRCHEAKRLTVRTVVNPSKNSQGVVKGVITTYCEGVTWCPDWVKKALNAGT